MNPFTIEEVAGWFREVSAGKRLVAPNAEQCSEMVSQLNVILKRKSAVKSGILDMPTMGKNEKDLLKSGEKFANCLSALRERQIKSLDGCRIPQNVEAVFDFMAKTEESVRAILQLIDMPAPDWSDDENAHFIYEAAQDAWAAAGRAPRSTAAGDPLVALVTRALNEIEKRIAPSKKNLKTFQADAVRDWIIGRRRQRKVWHFPESILTQSPPLNDE